MLERVEDLGADVLAAVLIASREDAPDLAAKLGEGLEDGAPVEVDTSGLEDIDTCILQLLSSLRKIVPVLSFDNPSETFISAVDRRGLRRELLNAREGL